MNGYTNINRTEKTWTSVKINEWKWIQLDEANCDVKTMEMSYLSNWGINWAQLNESWTVMDWRLGSNIN